MSYEVLFSGNIGISFSQFTIEPECPEDNASIRQIFAGQLNGLCSAAIPGQLFFTARPKDAVVELEIRLHSVEPEIEFEYSEIVEVSFNRGKEPVFLCQWAHEEIHPLKLPMGEYRVRYSVEGFDKDYVYEDEDDDECSSPIPGQRYLIQAWPQSPSQDQIIRQTSAEAAYWHKSNGSKR